MFDESKFLKPKLLLNNKLIIKLDVPEEITKGGIALPDKAQEKPSSGIIIDHCTMEDIKGKRAFFPSYAGTELTSGLKIIDFADIWWIE